ncbi:MRP4 protein, partial [Acromyrmex insinuator]
MNQTGQIMNLLSNDVIRFDQLTMYLNYIWIMPFMMSTYFNILHLVVALYFPQGLILLDESIVNRFNRLEDFLLMDEVNTRRFSENTPQLQFKSQKPKEESNAENQIDSYISRNGSIVLSEHQRLSDLPIYVKLQRVSAKWISGQLPPTLCNINLTIKPGQLCAVVVANVCALTKDFRQFPQGDMTMVSDRDVSLCGGQRARINLARAVYRQADIYLFDDPLSAVDTRVARHLYGKCITKYLHGKTRILITHQLQFLKRADHIVVLDRGYNQIKIEMLDNLNQAQRKEKDMRRASEMSKKITITKRISRFSTTNSIIHSDIDDSDYVENIPEAEMTVHGRVAGRVYKEYLHNSGNNFTLFVLLMIFIISQVATTGNYWLSYWTTLEDVNIENISICQTICEHTMIVANMYNDSFLGSIFTLNPDGLLSTVDAIYVYTFCIIACIATTLFRNFLYMKVFINSSSNLHIMFLKLLQARMSFFHNNLSGEILNRFSKDMGIMNEWLPKLMLKAIQGFCVVCGIMIMEGIINQWMLTLIVILVILFFFATKFYIKIGQNLEGVMKSPIFSYVNATLNGLPTIRSSGIEIEKLMRKRFDELQDRHSGT